MPVDRWEYDYLTFPSDLAVSRLMSALNSRGKEGWEIIKIDAVNSRTIVWLKRKRP